MAYGNAEIFFRSHIEHPGNRMKRKQKKSQQSSPSRVDPVVEAANYRDLLSPQEYDLLLNEIQHDLPPAIRVNPLKTSTGFAQHLGQKYGWELAPVDFCSTGFRVLNAAVSDVSAALEHHLGMYYIQEVASMLPAELFTPPLTSDLILDMAASPGGKTTHLISRSGDRGLVIANDSSQGRIQALRSVLQNWGAVNYAVTRFPAERYGEWFPDTFDRILLDAPCSMQGLRTAESHPSRPVSEKESLQLSRRQRAMLSSAIRALRVSGEVVYSTCTLLPEEDEVVIDAVLREFAGKIEVSETHRALPMPAPGLSRYKDQVFVDDVEKSIRLWPHRYQTAGFFACHLRKIDVTPGSESEPPFRPLEAVNYQVLSPHDESEFCQTFTELYGYDLAEDLTANHRTLVRHFDKVFIFPVILLERSAGLPVQAAGILLGEQTPDGFLPSQSWVSRFGPNCTRGVIRLNEVESAEWVQGKSLDQTPTGSMPEQKYLIVLDHQGYALGRASFTGNGLKNLLRKRLT